jgi:hypothetical protein
MSLSHEGLNPPFLGFYKQREKSKCVKIFFQMFNCKSIYNDYTYNYSYSYRKFHFQKVATQKWRREEGLLKCSRSALEVRAHVTQFSIHLNMGYMWLKYSLF